MQKIEIIALSEDSKRIIERLQRRGIVELCNLSDEGLVKVNTAYFVSLFDKDRTRMEQALDTVNSYAPEKTGLLDSFSKGKREVERHDFGKKASEFEAVRNSADKVLELSKSVNDLNNEIARLNLNIDMLSNWLGLDVATGFSGTASTDCFIGSIPEVMTEEQLAEQMPEGCQAHVVEQLKMQTNIAVIALKEAKEECKRVLGELGFSAIPDVSDKTPADKIAELKESIKKCEDQIEQNTSSIKELSKYRQDYEFMVDYLSARQEKYEQISKLAMTEETVILSGFIPEKYAPSLIKELEGKFKVAISVTEPDEEEDTPVLLENSKFSAPVEGITEMYALPNKKDLDPTPIMSFFYYFFFGLMLSDAGYGLLMVIGTAIALKKFNLEQKMRKTLTMFFYCGISTVFWGALFGSWFGDIVQVVGKEFFHTTITLFPNRGKDYIGSIALWFDPIKKPVTLLLFSFAFGICHLFLGLAAHFYSLWKEGKKWDAIFEVIPVYITVLGVAPIGAGIFVEVPAILSKIGGYMAIAGVVLVILTGDRTSKSFIARIFGGLYGLYNMATGYLGDILSYSRLLALGLATGSIAGVINLVGTLPSNLVLKAILLTVVFIAGHLLNLAINVLGAYVHTDRLQFVELFSKFYEGGGRAFEPFSIKTKYIKFKEEN